MTHRRAFFCVLTVLASLVLLGLILFSDHGFYDLLRLRNQQNYLAEGNDRLAEENHALSVEIERLKTDPKFIEDVARRELGMVGKEDLIIRPRNASGH
jgi:cell division protein FtsB